MSFNWQAILTHFPSLLKASITTLELVALSCTLGLILGVILGVLRLSKNPLVYGLPFLYVFFFRGTPLLIQIFLIYYGLAQFMLFTESFLWAPVLSKPYWCAIIALTLNTSAYIAEIVRGAILAVPKGELEAAQAIGMSKWQRLSRITLPRAFGIMVPAYTNEVIFMIKGSALASTIAIMDLTNAMRTITAKTYLTLEMYFAAGLIYLAMIWIFMLIAKGFERVVNRYKYSRPAH